MAPALALLLSLAGLSSPAGPPVPPVHDTHVSHTRIVLEGRTIALRIRLFHDDLQLALRRFSRDSTLLIGTADRADSLFAAYFHRAARFQVDGQALTLQVTGSGAERDQAAEQVVWYVLEGTVLRPPAQVVMLNAVLFEVFPDQQNIVQLLRLPEDRRQTLYFTARDPVEQRFTP